jgi:hypothetical protein
MRRTIRWMIRLYPRSWRARYSTEFDALLEDIKPRWSDIGDIAKAVIQMQLSAWKPGKITVALAIIGTLAAGITALRIPDTYLSTAVLKSGRSDSGSMANLVRNTMTRGALMKIINEENLYESERAVKPLEEVVDKMRRAVMIKAGAGYFTVSFTYPDQSKTQHATGDLARLLQQTGPTMALEVLEVSSGGPVYPNRLTMTLTGLGAGLLLGGVIAGMRRIVRSGRA